MKQRDLIGIEQKITPIFTEMEKGFRVDVYTLMDLKSSYEMTLSGLKKEIQEKLGRTIRLDSNMELGNLLFNDFGLPSLRLTPSGSSSVSIDVLERLFDSYPNTYPFLKSVIGFKNVQPLIKSLKTISNKLDLQGRIHPEFNHSTCPSGRIYSYIQNLPKEIRKVLIPDEVNS